MFHSRECISGNLSVCVACAANLIPSVMTKTKGAGNTGQLNRRADMHILKLLNGLVVRFCVLLDEQSAITLEHEPLNFHASLQRNRSEAVSSKLSELELSDRQYKIINIYIYIYIYKMHAHDS